MKFMKHYRGIICSSAPESMVVGPFDYSYSIDGVINDLVVYGRGDPSLSSQDLEDLVAQLKHQGIRHIDGDIIIDTSFFNSKKLRGTADLGCVGYYFVPEIKSLALDKNVIHIQLAPNSIGQPVDISVINPPFEHTIINKTVTTPEGSKSHIDVARALESNTIIATGMLSADNRTYYDRIAVHNVIEYIGQRIKTSLCEAGISVLGNVFISSQRLPHIFELAHLESSLKTIINQILKASDNLYSEMLLDTLGAESSLPYAPCNLEKIVSNIGIILEENTFLRGLSAIENYLKSIGIKEELLITDGSGDSRQTLATPRAMTKLLGYIAFQPYGSLFITSLPIAGVDGSLKYRFKNTIAEKNLRAKTGTMANVRSLAGYAQARSGTHLAISIIVNNYIGSTPLFTRAIDEITCKIIESF